MIGHDEPMTSEPTLTDDQTEFVAHPFNLGDVLDHTGPTSSIKFFTPAAARLPSARLRQRCERGCPPRAADTHVEPVQLSELKA
jgi:hypothetical protein